MIKEANYSTIGIFQGSTRIESDADFLKVINKSYSLAQLIC